MMVALKKFFCMVLISSVSMFALVRAAAHDAQVKKQDRYVVGLRIPSDTFAHRKNNPLFMTLAFLGYANEETLERAQKCLTKMNYYLRRPIQLKIGDEGSVKTRKASLSIIHVEIIDPAVKQAFTALYQDLAVARPFQAEKPVNPLWYIPARDERLLGEFTEKKGRVIDAGSFVINSLDTKGRTSDCLFEINKKE